MKIHFFLTFWLSFFISSNSISQTISLDYDNVLLNEILLDLNSRYGVQVSISSRLSSKCNVSIHQTVTSMDKAIDLLAEKCELDVQKIRQVYTFRKKKKQTPKTPKTTKTKRRKRFLFQGEILDKETMEPLPYVKISIGNSSIKSDQKGRFSYHSYKSIELFGMKQLGYAIVDTILSHGNKHILLLSTTMQEIEEINIIHTKPVETYNVTYGDELGRIQLNNVGTKFIAGSNNNLVFNNLRMYPGIMAAGESSSDFIIWGSSPGQGQITYDGITLFNSAGMNGDLGRVNPLMIKNIQVYKGGYNVNIGDRVGSVININSKGGSKKSTGATNLDNQMASLYLSVPLFKKKSTLQIAARKSYYQLLNLQEKYIGSKNDFVYPTYDYGDLNLKFTTVLKNRDRIQISSIASMDGYNEYLDKKELSTYSSHLSSKSYQVGSSINYVHNWKKGGITRTLLTQSMFRPNESFTSTYTDSTNTSDTYLFSRENGIDEYQFRIEHSLSATQKNKLDFSVAFIHNRSNFYELESSTELKNYDHTANRLSAYVMDKFSVWKRLHLQFGLKSDVLLNQLKPYLQPRINGKVEVTENWNINFGLGVYNQFVSKVQLIDSSGARSLILSLADEIHAPVQQSVHNVIGASYLGKSLEFGLEGYYKTFRGISRYTANDSLDNSETISGFGYGVDLFSKLRFKTHEIMISYSLGQFYEYGDSKDPSSTISEAEQSQLHEVKTSLNLHFKPITLSFAGAYGSGFKSFDPEDNLRFYSRIDVAVKYSKRLKKNLLSTGFSILNLLNTSNTRLFRKTNFSDNSSYSTLGIPFTPTVFFNFNF